MTSEFPFRGDNPIHWPNNQDGSIFPAMEPYVTGGDTAKENSLGVQFICQDYRLWNPVSQNEGALQLAQDTLVRKLARLITARMPKPPIPCGANDGM